MAEEKNLTCPECGRKYAPPADRCAIDGAPLYGPEVLGRVGQELNNYRIEDILGEGGMGVVYKAEHIMLKKPVAIKVLHDRFAARKGAATQFLREARAASLIRHPNIVDVTDFGKSDDGMLYFVMEYLEGESLEDILARDVRIPVFKAVNTVNQMARALGAAHEHGIVHQDLKPDNIYLINREGRRRIVRKVGTATSENFVVEPEGSFDFVKLLDFGVAKFNEDNLGPGLTAKTGMVFGTPHYMSPEQAQGLPVDPRADVYSLGILFYEMLLGVVPFDSESALEILNGHVSGKVIPPSKRDPLVKLDEATDRTIMRCLEKKPDDRYQTMEELCLALRDCFTDRVFLRDAHRLPGAVEAGIVPPPAPSRPMETVAKKRARSAAVEMGKKRLSEELAELFASKSGPLAIATANQEPIALDRPKRPSEDGQASPARPTHDVGAASRQPPRGNPGAKRSRERRVKTAAGIGRVTAPAEQADRAEPRKKRITEPLAAKPKTP